MKKTLLSLFAFIMATVAFAGDGTKENPYTVAEVLAFTPMDGTVSAYVKGYIVGTVPSGSNVSSFTTDAGESASNTNLFIADSQTETDYHACAPIQLPKGDVRDGLNLKENPTNLGKTVVLFGSLNKYFGVPGVKSVTEFTLSGETTYDGGGDDPGTTTQTNYIFTKATSLTNGGKYLIGATVEGTVKVAQNLPSNKAYGYLQVTDATETDGKIKVTSLDNIYTISGSNIIDSQGRYVYQTGSFNSFNVATDASEGIDWTITFNEDGTVMITNDDVQKTVQYDPQFGSYGSYEDVHGIFPALYLLTGTEEVTPVDPVETPLSTIAAVQANTPGKYKIQGTVVATCTRGALVYDTTGYIYIYDTAISAAVGDQVTVEGTTSTYGGFQQFSSNNGYTLTKNGTATVTHPTAVDLDLDAWVAAPVIQYVKLTGNLAISGNYYNVTVDGKTAVGSLVYPTDEIKAKLTEGEVTVYGYVVYTSGTTTTYVNIVVTSVNGENVDPDVTPLSTIAAVQASEAGKYKIQGTVVATSTRGALVYDTTGYIYIYDTAISAAVGDQVTVEGTTSEYGGFKQFSSSNGYTLNKTGTATVTHPTAVELDLDAWATAPVMQYVKLTGNLAISGNYYNVTVDGKTAVGSLVYPTDEIKAKLAEGEVIIYGYAIYTTTSKGTTYVNILVTSVNGENVDPDVTPLSTIAAVQASEAGKYKIQGTVVATSTRGALVYDTTGYIYIYDTAISATVGDQVTVEGTTSTYGGFQQFSASNGYTLSKTGTATVTHPAAVDLDLDAWAAAPVMQYVKLTGNLAISGNYYNVTAEGKTAVGSLVYPTDEIKAKLAEGEVTIYGYAVYTTTSKGTTYVNIITTSVGSDTAVKGIDADQKVQEIYDLAGRRVSKMTKGLYIVGGKKILK